MTVSSNIARLSGQRPAIASVSGVTLLPICTPRMMKAQIGWHRELHPGQYGDDRHDHTAGKPGRRQMQIGEDGAAESAQGKREKNADQNIGLNDVNNWR